MSTAPARRRLLCAALVLALALPAATLAQDETWSLLRQRGYVVLMRHSHAPGYGDPPGYRLDDCATQRNLSEEGRAHARRTGEAFRKRGVKFDRVLTSPWCRCKETARLVIGPGGPDAEPFAPLSNLVGRTEHRDRQVEAIKAFLAGLDADTRVLLVTHGVVVRALTGITLAEGEMAIASPDKGGAPTVLGRLRVD